VRFKHSKEAHTSISSMNGQRIANKRLLCKLANQSPASHYNNTLIANNPILSLQAPSTNLYVKPLLPTTTEGESTAAQRATDHAQRTFDGCSRGSAPSATAR
jgi:hypothetical protein